MDLIKFPKPNFARSNFVSLNGEWDFLLDESDVGEREPRYKVFPKDCLKINVPFCYQSNLSGIVDKSKHENVWYHKMFEFNVSKDQRVLLHIGAADYYTKIYVNQKFVGEHKGGYCEFCFDITDFLDNGKGDITVYCNDTYAINQPRGKQKWRDSPFGCWYQEITGIWKNVWAEIVGKKYIEDFRFTSLKDFKEHVEIKFNNDISAELQMCVLSDKKIILNKTLPINGNILNFDIDLVKPKMWSNTNPYLYNVSFKVVKNGEILDDVCSYFGYRFIETRDRKILINNNEEFLRLVLEQGYYVNGIYTFENEEQIINEVKLIKSLGFNGLRMHQKVEDPRFYYACDVLGLYVWSEMPSTYEFDELSIINNKREWKEVLTQHYNHPSIIVWTPCNECWGVPGVRHNVEQQNFLNEMYDLTKKFDQTRLVVSDDGWLHCKTDIVTLHNYIQDPERFKFFVENVNDIVMNNKKMDDMNDFVPFADGYHYENQPIMYDEFCGIGYDISKVKESWGYGTKVENENGFFNRFEGIVKAATNKNVLAGWCITQISDVYQEVNGLVTMDRKSKFNSNKLLNIISK